MIIKQAFVVSKFFRESFTKKYSLDKYRRDTLPVIFFGCYPKQYHLVLNHKSKCVVIWAGSDSLHLLKNTRLARQFHGKDNIKHIAISNFISNDLKTAGIKHKVLPIVPFDNSDFTPVPIGTKIYTYSAHTNPEFYGERIIEKIKRNFPKTEVIKKFAHPPESIPRTKIKDIYSQCALALRLTPHDGMSNTVVEMGLMGRYCIWNGNTPNAIPWKYVIDICENIEKQLMRAGQIDYDLAEKMNKFLNINNDFLNTEFYD